MPTAFAGIVPPTVAKCVNGVGFGVSVIHSSGHTPCVPCVSLVTSNEIVPVRPAKLKGCFGYIVVAVRPPDSNAPVGLSLDDSRNWPLQMMISPLSTLPGTKPVHPTIVAD